MPGISDSRNNPKRILVVEDSADGRKLLVLLLTRAGYETIGAATKAEALKLFAKNNFDLFVSDICLADGSGLDLMRELATIRPIKGIAYTGLGNAEDAARSLAAGFSVHLLKPLRGAEMLLAIEQLLESQTNSGRDCHSSKIAA